MESESVLHLPASRNPQTQEMQSKHKFSLVDGRASSSLLSQMDKAIEEDGKEITRTLGIPDTLGVTDTRAGSFALGKVQFDSFTARPENAQAWVSAHIQRQVIRDIVKYNYPSWLADPNYFIPQYKFELLDEDFQNKVSQRVREEFKAGLIDIDEARSELGKVSKETVDETDAV